MKTMGLSELVAMDALLAELEARHLGPLWRLYERIVKREPEKVEPSHLWRWSTLDPLITQAMTAVNGADADHRVLLLMHPAFAGAIATTTNLLVGLQCVLPGERTVPHRHTAAAVRYVMESEGARTFVDGKACVMRSGDLIVTPNWTWHAHENDTTDRAVWLDMLDAPLTGLLAATFGARGAPAVYPESLATLDDAAFAQGGLSPVSSYETPPYTPRVHWRSDDVLAALTHAPPQSDGSRLVRYTNPVSGGAITATLDVFALELRGNQATEPRRSSDTSLCVVMEGEGASSVGDAVHAWRTHDVFTLPQWTTYTHTACTDVARLLVVSDREAYRRLGLWREERF